MCRLAAFPPRFPKSEALHVMHNMMHRNKDGVGTAHLRGNEFMVHKYPGDLNTALSKGVPLFDHMPHNGWTIAHMRQATHGGNTPENTHPFIKGPYCIVHNGVYGNHEHDRATLAGFVKFKGQTDSETAAYLIRKLGPRPFTKLINEGGVYLALQRDGTLHAMKTSGMISFVEVDQNRGYMLASEMHKEWYAPSKELQYGWFHFGTDGFLLTDEEAPAWGSQSQYHRRDLQSPRRTRSCSVQGNRADSKSGSCGHGRGQCEQEPGDRSPILAGFTILPKPTESNTPIYPPYQHEVGRYFRPVCDAPPDGDDGGGTAASSTAEGTAQQASSADGPESRSNPGAASLEVSYDPRLWSSEDCDSLSD